MFEQVKQVLKLSELQQFLLLTLICQVAFWYLGSPGPSLLNNAERDLVSSVKTIGASIVFLLLIPIVWSMFSGFKFRDLGIQIGSSQVGLVIVGLLSLVAIPILFFASRDISIQETYPWSGTWAGESVTQYFVWIALYAIYYAAYEFFYRGFILKAGERFFTPQLCMLLQVAFSVMIHLGKPFPETLAAIPAGFLFGWLAIKTKSLIYPILLHLAIGALTDLFSLYHQNLLEFLP